MPVWSTEGPHLNLWNQQLGQVPDRAWRRTDSVHRNCRRTRYGERSNRCTPDFHLQQFWSGSWARVQPVQTSTSLWADGRPWHERIGNDFQAVWAWSPTGSRCGVERRPGWECGVVRANEGSPTLAWGASSVDLRMG